MTAPILGTPVIEKILTHALLHAHAPLQASAPGQPSLHANLGRPVLHRSSGPACYTTGRPTSEVVTESAQLGVPIIVSRSGVKQQRDQLAQRLGLAIVGRAVNRLFAAETDLERADSQTELAVAPMA